MLRTNIFSRAIYYSHRLSGSFILSYISMAPSRHGSFPLILFDTANCYESIFTVIKCSSWVVEEAALVRDSALPRDNVETPSEFPSLKRGKTSELFGWLHSTKCASTEETSTAHCKKKTFSFFFRELGKKSGKMAFLLFSTCS